MKATVQKGFPHPRVPVCSFIEFDLKMGVTFSSSNSQGGFGGQLLRTKELLRSSPSSISPGSLGLTPNRRHRPGGKSLIWIWSIYDMYIPSASGKPGKLTWQWKMDLSKCISLLFPIEDGDFSLPCWLTRVHIGVRGANRWCLKTHESMSTYHSISTKSEYLSVPVHVSLSLRSCKSVWHGFSLRVCFYACARTCINIFYSGNMIP